MVNHPINLIQVYFTKVSVEALPNFQLTTPHHRLTYLPENNLRIEKIKDSPKQFMAIMTTKINKDKDQADPYSIDIECVGIFASDESISGEEEVKGIYITAHSVLYGAIRESISWITGRQPHGPLPIGLSILQGEKVK